MHVLTLPTMSNAHPPTDVEATPAKVPVGRRRYRQVRWTEAAEVLAQALADTGKSLLG